MKLEKYQGINDDGSQFGYVHGDDGGYFFTWCDTLSQTLESVEVDAVDGDGGLSEGEVVEFLERKLVDHFED